MAQVTVTPPSRFVRLARLCNRHRWRTFGVWLLALILIQVVAASVGVKEISSFRLPGTESQRAYDLLAEHFPAAKGDTDQIVYKARSGSLEDAANRARIESSIKKVRAQKDVASVASPFGEGGRLTQGRPHRGRHAQLQGEHERHRARRPRGRPEGGVHRPQRRRSKSSTAVPAPRSFASATARAPRRASASSPRRSCCCSRSDRWWRRPSR